MTVIIGGASSGFGRALAECYAAAGHQVVDFSRSGQVGGPIHAHYDCDLAVPASIDAAVAAALAAGQVPDILILNGGFGIGGPVEDSPPEALEEQLAVNLNGNIRLARLFLPALRARFAPDAKQPQGSTENDRPARGRIIIMSSMAAVLPLPFQCLYSVSKAGLLAFGQALDGEIKAFNLDVMVVLPGDMQSNFTARRRSYLADDSVYRERYQRCLAKIEKDEQSGAPAMALAKSIYKKSLKRRLPASMTYGTLYHLARFLLRILPERAVMAILRRMYAV